MTRTEYPITPVPKPRQTQADRWKKRPAVLKYRAFADECRLRKVRIPEAGAHIIFVLPMPRSWSERKKKAMDGQPHQVRPDRDNLEKALLDALYAEDAVVWDARTTKVWGREGKIVVIEDEIPCRTNRGSVIFT